MPHKFPGNCPYLFIDWFIHVISSFLKGGRKEKSQTWTTLTPCKCCENKLDIFSTWIFLLYSLVRALLYSMLFSPLLGTSITQIIKNSHTNFFSAIIFLQHRGWSGLRTPNSDLLNLQLFFQALHSQRFLFFTINSAALQLGPAHAASHCQGKRQLHSPPFWAAALSQTLPGSSTSTFLFPGWGG